jgi:hypothetical protein
MSRLALQAAALVAALALTLAVPAFAQDGGGDCELLTSDEVADVLGTDAPSPMVSEGTCTWMTGTGMVMVGVIPGFGIDTQRSIFPGGVDTTIAGFDAYYVAEAGQLFIDLDGRQLFIAIAGGDPRDAERVLLGLAESAVARVPTQAAPPEGSLASMFPTEIGGRSVIVQQVPEDQVAAMMGADPGVREAIETTLAGMGKTMADLEVAFGTAQGGQLFAYRIEGEDAAGFLPLFVEAFMVGNPGGETSVQPIAGKDVTVASAGGQTIAHLYPSGDILWTVIAVEPGLSEILTALP